MVADSVEVLTRKAGQDAAFLWTSDGKEGYAITPSSRDGHGTTITLKVNDGGQEFLSAERRGVLQKYSNHVAFPIILATDQDKYNDMGKTEVRSTRRAVNAPRPLAPPKSEIRTPIMSSLKTSADTDESPLVDAHEGRGTIEYSTLFTSVKAPIDFTTPDYPGVKLYVRRVVSRRRNGLLTTISVRARGVDSEDLPLNVSREILQQNA
jgi:molecular chaperone HtpG